jgi:hypothetical protein
LSVALEYSALQVFSDECVFFVIEWALLEGWQLLPGAGCPLYRFASLR